MTTAASTTCPECGADAGSGATRCRTCGFTFVEATARPPVPRPSRSAVAATALVALTVLAAVVALDRESPSGPPPAPAPLAPAQAEDRLQRQLGLAADGDQGVVRCPGNVGPTRLARCGVTYPDGDTQLLPVRLTPAGDLDVEVPYPAQRRPGP